MPQSVVTEAVAGAPGLIGGKPEAAVKAESDALIAEIMAEGVESIELDDNGNAKPEVKPAKGKKGKADDDATGDDDSDGDSGGDDSDVEPEADDSELDETDGDDDESEGEESGGGKDEKGKDPPSIAAARRLLKNERKAFDAERSTHAANVAQLQRIDGELSRSIEEHNAKYGKYIDTEAAIKSGDPEAIKTALEGQLNMTIDEAVLLLAGQASPTDIKLARLERERKAEREAAQAQQVKAQQEAQKAEANAWIAANLKGHKLARHPGAEELIWDLAKTTRIETKADLHKAASVALKALRIQKAQLDKLFGEVAAEPAVATETAPKATRDKERRGSPNRAEAASGASQGARAQTTGDLIADVMGEEFGAAAAKRAQGLRGKKVGAF